MYLEMDKLKPVERYHLLTQSIIPRPIAWVLTDNGKGEGDARYNLAPFSFFNVVSSSPPLLVLGIHTKKSNNNEIKDTLKNIRERKLATIHIVSSSNFDCMVDSAAELPHGKSELLSKNSSLTLCKNKNTLPRIKESPIAFFCEMDHIYEAEGGTTSIVFCKIISEYIDDSVVETQSDKIVINPEKVNPVSRLGLLNYAKLKKVFQVGNK